MITVDIDVNNQETESTTSSPAVHSINCFLNNLRFRKLGHNDLETLKCLCEDWFPISYPSEWYNAVVQGEYFYPLAATINGQIVGVIVADIWSRSDCDHCDRDILPATKFPDDTRVAYILSFGVVKEYRRLGIGSRLLDKLIDELTSNNQSDQNEPSKTVKAVYLHVQCDNKTAITFYRSKSFRIHRYLPWYYCNTTGNGDAYSYVRYINGASTSWIYTYPFARCPLVSVYRLIGKLPYLLWRVLRILKLYRVPLFRVTEKITEKPKEITA